MAGRPTACEFKRPLVIYLPNCKRSNELESERMNLVFVATSFSPTFFRSFFFVITFRFLFSSFFLDFLLIRLLLRANVLWLIGTRWFSLDRTVFFSFLFRVATINTDVFKLVGKSFAAHFNKMREFYMRICRNHSIFTRTHFIPYKIFNQNEASCYTKLKVMQNIFRTILQMTQSFPPWLTCPICGSNTQRWCNVPQESCVSSEREMEKDRSKNKWLISWIIYKSIGTFWGKHIATLEIKLIIKSVDQVGCGKETMKHTIWNWF